MPALLFNLHSTEILIVAIIAILVFGRRLPEVAAQAAHGLGRLKGALEKMRQDTGIDQELREVQRSVHQGLEHVRVRDLQRAAHERLLEESGVDEETRRQVREVREIEIAEADETAEPLDLDPPVESAPDSPDSPGEPNVERVDPFAPPEDPDRDPGSNPAP